MLNYEAAPRRRSRFPDSEWVVEAIDDASEGEIYAASFEGHNAEGRAREYAAWKNSGGGRDWHRPPARQVDPLKTIVRNCTVSSEPGKIINLG